MAVSRWEPRSWNSTLGSLIPNISKAQRFWVWQMLGRYPVQWLNWRWGLSAPFSLPSAHSAWGSPPRLWSSLLPMGPQLSLHLQPSPLSQNAGVDTQWPARPLYPDNSRACLEAAPFFLTSALPDLTPSAAGTIPETWVSSSSSSFSLLHPTQSNSNSVDQSPQSLAVCPLLSIPLSL